METRWVYKEIPDAMEVQALSEGINVSPAIATILVQRNIRTFEDAKSFFRPTLEQLHDPFLMKDMDKAVERLETALKNNEKILIYGDYDVDGTTSVALFYGFISKRYPHTEYYLPDRYKEGYGVSKLGIQYAADNGFTLIISLDCGIKAETQIAFAKSLGIDFIVCDHHNTDEKLPDAYAILDPKRKGCNYPFKELSGCGVGFKFLQAYCQKNDLGCEELFRYMDLVALSVASDIVPIVGENRVFTFHGINILNTTPRAGMKALINISGFKKALDISDLVFGIGPRINAAGRIAHAKSAVMILLSDEQEEATILADKINDKNILRKDFDSTITEEALEMIANDALLKDAKSTVLYKDSWHKGVIGIVASRCIEKYYRPTIILTQSNDFATGSARSVIGFDVYEAISRCSHLLEQFGGHMYAAGLTLKTSNVQAFREKFEEIVSEIILPEQLIPRIEVDLKIKLNQINYKFYNIVKQMAPFGPWNMKPLFVSENVSDTGKGSVLKDKHLKVFLKQEDDTVVEAIGFGLGNHFERIKNKEPFNVCYHICENEYNGRKTLQLLIKDIKFNTDAA